MAHRRLWPVLAVFFAVSGFAPVFAQEEEKLPYLDPWKDLESYDDPDALKEDPLFEEPLEKYDGSEAFLEEAKEGIEATVDPMDQWAALNCSSLPAGFVAQPIRLAAANPRYFSYGEIPRLLIGASADSGCLFKLTDKNQCNLDNYPTTFALNRNTLDSPATPLNKVRIWIGMGYGYADAPTLSMQVPNAPFQWVTPLVGSPYWLLDQPGVATPAYTAFFDRLVAVVNAARLNKQFVEVTFFIPWQGKDFRIGPWSKAGGLAKKADPPSTANHVLAGFSSTFYQVHKDTSSPDAVNNEKMRAYQINVIKWAVKALWCFDNVYFEVANEPEAAGQEGDGLARKAVNPVAVAKWQRAMILEIRKAENELGGARLAYGHLIAAQPFSKAGFDALFDPANAPAAPSDLPVDRFPLGVQVLNGHYTTVANTVSTFGGGSHPLDLGAIGLIRDSVRNKKPIPYACNEDNITNASGPRGTRHHLNGAIVEGGVDPIRAAAYELLTSGGTSYDHFGYLALDGAVNDPAKRVRVQLGRLLDFYGRRSFDLPSPTPKLTDFAPANMNDFFAQGSAGLYAAWECRTRSQLYWSALAATARTSANQIAYRALLLYRHHSTPRCKTNTEDYLNKCNSGPSPFGSYDARIWTVMPPLSTDPQITCSTAPVPPGYRDTFSLKAGNYELSWIDPETTLPYAGTPAVQTVNCPAGGCSITSPVYKFDILLRLVKR